MRTRERKLRSLSKRISSEAFIHSFKVVMSSTESPNHPRLQHERITLLSLDGTPNLESGRNVNELFNELEKVEDKIKDMKDTGTVHKTCGERVSVLKAKAESNIMKAILTRNDSLNSLEKCAESLESVTFDKVNKTRSGSLKIKVTKALEDKYHSIRCRFRNQD